MTSLLNYILGIGVAFAENTAVTKDQTAQSSAIGVLGFVVDKLPMWITAAIVFVVSVMLALMVKGIVESKLASKISDEHKEMQIMTGRIAFVCVIMIGVSIALTIAGINMTTLLAAVGFGISFGLQDIVSNFVAGLYLLASHPFAIGDWIKINGKTGRVEVIGARATYLRTYDGLRLIVANSELFKGEVLSYTTNSMRRLKVPVYTRYGLDMRQVKKICLDVIKSNRRVLLQPKPSLVVVDLADYYVYLEARFWVDSKSSWRKIQSEVFMAIQKHLEKAGMDSPYPVSALTLNDDCESYVLKTKTVDETQYKQMVSERKEEDKKYRNKKKEYLKKDVIFNQPMTVDQEGFAFLKAEKQMNMINEQNPNQVPLYNQSPVQIQQQSQFQQSSLMQNSAQLQQPVLVQNYNNNQTLQYQNQAFPQPESTYQALSNNEVNQESLVIPANTSSTLKQQNITQPLKQ